MSLKKTHQVTITHMFYLSLQSYILPNQPINEKTPLHMFQVPTDTIEKASGLIVFDKVPRHNIKQIRPTIPVSSWRKCLSRHHYHLFNSGLDVTVSEHFDHPGSFQTNSCLVQQPLRIIDGLDQFDTFQALLKAWLPYFMSGFPGL